jgi:hypothetical protein
MTKQQLFEQLKRKVKEYKVEHFIDNKGVLIYEFIDGGYEMSMEVDVNNNQEEIDIQYLINQLDKKYKRF